MSAWGHRFVRLTPHERSYGCNSCRGDWETKPRAEVGFRYDYVTGRAGRVTWAQRGLCTEHAKKAANKYALQLELLALLKLPPLTHDRPKNALDAAVESITGPDGLKEDKP